MPNWRKDVLKATGAKCQKRRRRVKVKLTRSKGEKQVLPNVALRLACKGLSRLCARAHHRCSALPAAVKIEAYDKARGPLQAHD
jgi:hypothetical protein